MPDNDNDEMMMMMMIMMMMIQGLLAHLTLKHEAVKITEVTDLIVHHEVEKVENVPESQPVVEEVKANVTEGKDEKVVEKAEIVKTESVEEPLQVSITHEDHAGNNSISGYTDNTTSGVFHADITWKCRTCSKTFASEELVKQHVLMFHLMERFDKTAQTLRT